MFQAITNSFPSNYWRHKITKGKESDRCDLCKAPWIEEEKFTTDDNLPIQTLGHIQHMWETLSTIHTLAHHHYWSLLHTNLARLASSEWGFIWINGEKNFRTIWTDSVTSRQIPRDLDPVRGANSRECSHGSGNETPHDSGRRGRMENRYPQGNDSGRKNMEQKTRRINYYSIRVHKVGTRTNACPPRMVGKPEATRKPSLFQGPSPDMESRRSKLDFQIIDEYANILKGMYSMRFNGSQ